MSDIKKLLQIDDLPDIQKEAAEAIGIDAYLKLSGTLGGKYIYVPKAGSLDLYVIKRLVKAERKNGSSVAELSERYQLDPRTVRGYLKEKD